MARKREQEPASSGYDAVLERTASAVAPVPETSVVAAERKALTEMNASRRNRRPDASVVAVQPAAEANPAEE